MAEIWNEKMTRELNALTQFKEIFRLSSNSLTYLGEYLIILATLEKKTLPEELKKEIINFYKNIEDSFQIQLFLYLELGKRLDYLNIMYSVLNGKSIHLTDGIKNIKNKISQMISIFDLGVLKNEIQTGNFLQLQNFNNCFLTFWNFLMKQDMIEAYHPNILLFFNELSDESIHYYKVFLEEHTNITFDNQNTPPFNKINMKAKAKKTNNYLTPLNQRIQELERLQKQEEAKKQKLQEMNRQKELALQKIDKICTQNTNRFIFLNSKEIKEFNQTGTKDILLTKVIEHNKVILQNQERKLEELQHTLNDNYKIAFIDFNYFCPEESLLQEIKKNITLEDLTKLLKGLNKKEYSFLNTNHPLFLNILLNTTETTLKEISKEIEEKLLPSEYLSQYPTLLYETNWLQYKKNKTIITQNNLTLSFFQNSDLLMTNETVLNHVITLLKEYHCCDLAYYNFDYFNQLDSKIEKRLELPTDLPELEDPNTRKVNQQIQNPPIILNLENLPEEIKQLDETFQIDHLRYFIAGVIISRLKVIRYFNALNKTNENPKENLIQAIFYNTHFFEFEKEQILEALNSGKKLQKDYPSN